MPSSCKTSVNCRSHTQGLIAAAVCMSIWNLQGFLLQAVFQQWNCTLFASYTSSWFLSTHLVVGMINSYCNDANPKQSMKAILCNKKNIFAAILAGLALILSNISSNFAFSDIDTPVPLAVATFHLSIIYTLFFDWMFQRKRPSFVNLTGCILLLEGVFAFNLISYQEYAMQSVTISAVFQPGFLWANSAAVCFAVYSYVHETLLSDIPSEYALGLIGISNTLYGWIPSLAAHELGFQVLSVPGSMSIGFIALNGVTEIFAEYAAIYSLRKTSSFTFNGTLTLASPLALFMMFIQNYFILHTATRWTWMYIPALFNIVIGCVYVYWRKSDSKQPQAQTDQMLYWLCKQTDSEIDQDDAHSRDHAADFDQDDFKELLPLLP